MFKRSVFLIAGLLALPGFGVEANAIVNETQAREFASAGGVFRYRWAERQATAGNLRPLVLFLHGAGERGTNNVAQLVHGVPELLNWLKANETNGYVLLAGQVPINQRWVEVNWAAESGLMPEEPSEPMRGLMALVEKLFAEDASIDRSRVYVTGISMGGYGTWDLIARRPEWFAAAMPICGGGDPTQVGKLEQVAIWAFHGSSDNAVPVGRTREMMSALWAYGVNAHYREYPDAGHNVWKATYGDKGVLKWFFAQRRKSEIKRN